MGNRRVTEKFWKIYPTVNHLERKIMLESGMKIFMNDEYKFICLNLWDILIYE